MRQGRFLISIVCALIAAASQKDFDKSSIATEKSFCNSKGVHNSGKQCRRIYICYFALQKYLLGTPKPLNCIRRMQATRFCKTLFGCAIGVRSNHGSTMITGFEVLPAQAALVAVSICTKPKRTQYPQPRQ